MIQPRRKTTISAFGFLFSFVLLLSYTFFSPADSLYLRLSPRPPPDYSALENYEAGRWQPLPQPITSLSSIHTLYPGAWFDANSCGGGLERLFRIASWEWVGEDGSSLDFDGRRFLVDLLRRGGGILIVGDSISKMHFDGVLTLLRVLSFEYETSYSTSQPLVVETVLERIVGHPSHAVITLNPSHPAVEDLLRQAGVGKERVEEPLAQMFRSNYLGTDAEAVDLACAENGVKFDWDLSALFLVDWLSVVKNYTNTPSPARTIVVLNTGPFVDTSAPLDVALGVITSMVQRAFTSLAALPNLEVIVRTSYPGQVQCGNFTVPFEDVSSANNDAWGWYRIPLINDILRENMGLLSPTPSLLLDVERQGTLRGDARLHPDGDCLHMCPTAISEEWARWVGMALRKEEGWGPAA